MPFSVQCALKMSFIPVTCIWLPIFTDKMERLGYLFLLFGFFSIQASSEDLKENLALKGKAVQSTTYFRWAASYAIDGIRYGPGEASFCSITLKQLSPWWRLDLLDNYYIDTVTITNRADCCPERMTGVEVRIGNSLENNGNNNPRCGVVSTAVPAGGHVSFSCGGMAGRYVNMFAPNIQTYLTLCEVEVYREAHRKKTFLRMKLASNVDSAAVNDTFLNKLQSALGLVSDCNLSWSRLQKEKHEVKQTPRFCADKH